MVRDHAESISWIDRARGVTFTTRQEFTNDFLAGWVDASSDCRITDARYTDADDMVLARFTVTGTNDGPLGPFPATGKEWALPICELWQFDADGRVVGGEIYYPGLAAHAAGAAAGAVPGMSDQAQLPARA
jgi:hypothetical protein